MSQKPPPENIHEIGFCLIGCVIELATSKQLWDVPFPPYGLNILSGVHFAVAVALFVCGLYGIFCNIQDNFRLAPNRKGDG